MSDLPVLPTPFAVDDMNRLPCQSPPPVTYEARDLPAPLPPFAAEDARQCARGQIQRRVEEYWNSKPCDSELSSHRELSRQFFLEVESERYRLQSHIPSLLDSTDWAG